ncbi:MAG TPA: putative sulfate exporter family transporter [Gaiellaceae bacterium]|jgi:uncharacterized integral membrane protein (TIGR00698 family)|nr:putative sulfate exporter family transporter [Gaiellaceae bacterium]
MREAAKPEGIVIESESRAREGDTDASARAEASGERRGARRSTRTGIVRDAAPAALAIAAAVTLGELLGATVPVIGPAASALLVGILIRLWYTPTEAGRPVIAFASRTVLKAAIVVLGATFGLSELLRVGGRSLPLMLGTLAAALLVMYPVGRALRVDWNLTTLVGVGTAICGASAIGAISGVIEASEVEIAYAISTIFVFNVAAVILFPAIGHLLGLSQQSFGMWAGTAVNDTSSVVATASAYGHAATQVAVVTKLARTTMIVPIAFALALTTRRRAAVGTEPKAQTRVWRLLPGFLVLFLAAAAVNTAGLISPSTARDLARIAAVLITVALASIGLSTSVRDLRRTGYRPLLLGAVLWAVVAVSGLLLQTVI